MSQTQSCSQPQAFVDHAPAYDSKRRKARGTVLSKKGFYRPDKRRRKPKFL